MRRLIRPGDIFEDCAHHPVLCYRAEPRVNDSSSWWRRWVLYEIFGSADDWDLDGISLLDASRPRSCSAKHCGIRKLTAAEAFLVRKRWERSEAAPDGQFMPWVDPFPR